MIEEVECSCDLQRGTEQQSRELNHSLPVSPISDNHVAERDLEPSSHEDCRLASCRSGGVAQNNRLFGQQHIHIRESEKMYKITEYIPSA